MSNSFSEPIQPLIPQKCAIVVGASSGIGAAMVELLADHGYRVAAVARREAKLSELCDRVNQKNDKETRAFFFAHNVTKYNDVPALFQQIVGNLGGLDLFVYTAGTQPSMTPEEYNFDKDKAMVDVNLLGAMAWLNLVATRFGRAGEGHIVGVSSIAAERGRRPSPGYNASKAGLDTYLEGLRNRLTSLGVTVTTVRPGFVETRLLENAKRTFWVIPPEKAGKQIFSAIRRRKQVVYVPARWRYFGLVIRHIPSIIFRRLNF